MKKSRSFKVNDFQTQLENMACESSGWNPAITGAGSSVYLKSGTGTDVHIKQVREI